MKKIQFYVVKTIVLIICLLVSFVGFYMSASEILRNAPAPTMTFALGVSLCFAVALFGFAAALFVADNWSGDFE